MSIHSSSATPFVIFLNEARTYTLHVAPSAEALAELAAKAVAFTAQKAVERRGVFHWALSGGSTPRALYALLARTPFVEQIAWEHVHVWWSDERNVPADHAESNYRMAHDALLAHVPIPQTNIHRVRTELGAEHAAAHYEADLRATFGVNTPALGNVPGAGVPRFDLILLGMGDDGHTASLFPSTAALQEQARWVVANAVPRLNALRITFTYPLINAADAVLFLVSGAGKAETLRRVLLGTWQPEVLPAQGVMPLTGRLMWMVDAAAASLVMSSAGYLASEVIYRRAAPSA
ncbi:MAG: 6-phosphogluconolactonase [Anaerolineae bacterium]|nr:6-phosphogluconolactonase [Anaerolineae bacterium]